MAASGAVHNVSETPQTIPSPSSQRESSHRGQRSRRGQHGLRHQPASNHTPRPHSNTPLSLRPASIPASTSSSRSRPDASELNESTTSTQNRTGRGSRRGRGPGYTAAGRVREVAGGRAFGGQLTRTDTQNPPTGEASSASLRGDAPSFNPGLDSASASNASRRTVSKKRRPSKSAADNLATRLHEDIDHKQYECAICTSNVVRNSKIWSCSTCWTVFHLSCVKQWAMNSQKNVIETGNETNGSTESQVWRCPGCNLPQHQKPSIYTCWCGKEQDPKTITGLPPHSCGQTCGKERHAPKSCPHRCDLLCHAGPCSPCGQMGPSQSCFCGKQSSQKKCVETDYVNGWSCGRVCGDEMPCGEHNCQRVCHEGLCGACEARFDAKCMCGADNKAILCCDRDDDQICKRSYLSNDGEGIEEEWIGRFRCEKNCGRSFDCGKHKCQKPCHPSTTFVTQCPRSPKLVTRCPCGKTPLSKLLDEERASCEDPIPNCAEQCMKKLSCGHYCQQKCHADECLPCLQNIDIQCRCKRITVSSICHQGSPEPPQCTRICRTTLNCGRHECAERCCLGERRAIERNASRKRGRPLGAAPDRMANEFEAEHICTRMCGRTLKCGSHVCQELCHKGTCASCKEAVFDEIACNCGRTVLQPPLPCGTKAPPCRYECQRAKLCGHPQVQHNCHGDGEACPKCPFLVEKLCICGKKRLKNQQCWFTDVRCGQVCGKQLRCGRHTCRKTCHRPRDCEDSSGKCIQACGALKKVCNHPCEDQCHVPYPCKQDKQCPHKLLITCPCQTRKEEVRCGASASSEGNLQKELKCDDECARLERNRKLATALDIDPATHTDQHIPYSADTLKMYSEMPSWCSDQEREFRVFASSSDERRLRFKPMPSHNRNFLHNLAEDYGLDCESMDPEPYRHVAIFKTPRFVSAPNKTLRDAWRIRQNQLREEGRELIANAQAKANVETKAKEAMNGSYNGYLVKKARFALTEDDLLAALAGAQSNSTTTSTGPDSNMDFSVHFLPNEDVALYASFHVQPHDDADRTLEKSLANGKASYSRALISQHKLGVSLHLARFDDSLNVVRQEGLNDGLGVGGWSQVAAKAAAPRRAPVASTVGQKSGFAVLQAGTGGQSSTASAAKSKSQAKKERKKERKASVADDWEAELAKEEAELEKAIMGFRVNKDSKNDCAVDSPTSRRASDATDAEENSADGKQALSDADENGGVAVAKDDITV